VKAKVMFAAVWIGGPRWYPMGAPDLTLESVPDAAKKEAFLAAKAFIEGEKPSMPVLVEFLEEEVRKMLGKKVKEKGEVDSSNQNSTYDPNVAF
jgi:arginine/ornithine N-succinyltransferase beta subunit